jgi:hypothetical protein
MVYNYGSWNPYGTGKDQVQGGLFGGIDRPGGEGETGGPDPEPFNWDDFASSSEQSSKSFSGLPEWASEWMKGWWPSYNKGMSDLWAQYLQGTRDKTNLNSLKGQDLQSLLANLGKTGTNLNQGVDRMRTDFGNATSGLDQYIEQSRKLMPQQYLEQMKLYNERAQQPVLNNLSNRGILNSSVTGGALSDVLRDTQAKYSDEATKANLWAANQGYDLGKYKADTGLGINKFGTESQYDLGKFGTTAQNELSRYFTDKNLGMDKEGRDATLQHFQTQFGMLPQLLAALRESQSESSGSTWGGLIELLKGGYE